FASFRYKASSTHRDLHSFPTRRSSDLKRLDAAAHMSGRELRAEQVEGIAHLQFVAAGRIGGERLQRTLLVAHLADRGAARILIEDRKSTRLNSSHGSISYAVFCLKKKI